MLEAETQTQLLTTYAGTLLAIGSAAFVWLIKSAYEKHRKEMLALSKLERKFVLNATIADDNLEFMRVWVDALKDNRPFSFDFEEFLIDNEETHNLSQLKLINKILPINYKLRRMGLDLKNIYSNYWEVVAKIDAIPDEQRKMQNLEHFHKTVILGVEEMTKNYPIINKDFVDVLACIRVAANVRKHSLFGYVSVLFTDVYPRMNKKAVEKEKGKLESEMAEKRGVIQKGIGAKS